MILKLIGRYICIHEFLVDELTYLDVELKGRVYE